MSARKRPVIQITLSPAAITRLDTLAARWGLSRSGMVERLVREAKMPKKEEES